MHIIKYSELNIKTLLEKILDATKSIFTDKFIVLNALI